MVKRFALLFMILVMADAATASQSWKNAYGDISNKNNISYSDASFLTESSAQYKASHYQAWNDVLAGNLDDDASTIELMVIDGDDASTGLYIFNATGSLIQDWSGLIGNYDVQYSYTLYDYDSDGTDEIIVIKNNKAIQSAEIKVFDYTLGIWHPIHSVNISQNVHMKTPVCYNTYCYIQDDTGRVYKYNPSTNSIASSINLGTSSSTDLYRMTIDDCDAAVSSPQLLFILDTDNNGWNNYAIVPLSSFSTGNTKTYNNYFGDAIQEKITCHEINTSIYLSLVDKFYTTLYDYCSYQGERYVNHRKFELHKINGSNVIYEDAQDAGELVLEASSANYPSYGGDIAFADYNNDGITEYCFTYNGFTFGTTNGWQCFGGTSKKETKCYSFQNKSLLYTVGYPSYGNSYYAFPSYNFDIDNDNKYEILSKGIYYLNPETQITQSTVETATNVNLRSFLNFGIGCTQWYYTIQGYMHSMLSSLPSCNLTGTIAGGENSLPSIYYSSISNTRPQQFEPVNFEAKASDIEGDDILWATDCNYAAGTTGFVPLMALLSDQWSTDDLVKYTNTHNASCGTNYYYSSPRGYTGWNMTMYNKPASLCFQEYNFYFNLTSAQGDSHPYINNFYYFTDIRNAGSSTGEALMLSGRNPNLLDIYNILFLHNFTSGNWEIYKGNGSQYSLLTTSAMTPSAVLLKVTLDNAAKTYRIYIDFNDDLSYEYTSNPLPFITNTNTEHDMRMGIVTVLPPYGYGDVTYVQGGVEYIMHTFAAGYLNLPSYTGPWANNDYHSECVYDTIRPYGIRIYATDDKHPEELDNYVMYEVNVEQQVVQNVETINSSILYPDETNGSIFVTPDISTCGAACQFVWFLGFPSRMSKMIDIEFDTGTFNTIRDAVAFSTIIFALLFLLISYDFNKTIIATWAYTLVHMFIGYMPMYVFIFMTFLLSIVVAAWKRSVETGLGGRMSGGQESEEYAPK